MKTLDKYVLKEMIAPFIVSVVAFVVLLIGRVLFDNMNFIIQKRVPVDLVARLIIYQMPWVIGIVLPLGTLFGTSLAVNRLSRDSEITAVRMAGTPLRRIFLPIFLVGLIASGLAFWLGESVTPWANRQTDKTKRFILGMQSAPLIEERVFFQSEGYHFYVQQVDRSDPDKVVLRNIMIYETPSPGKFPVLITAARATNDKNIWTLEDGVEHEMGADGFTNHEMKFETMKLNLRRALEDMGESRVTSETMGFMDLKERIDVLSKSGRGATDLKVDWHFKLSLPLACLIFALCGAPLSYRFAKSGSYSGILMGIIIMFLYQNNIWLGKALGIGGMIPPFLAGWSQNIIFGLVGLYMIWREE